MDGGIITPVLQDAEKVWNPYHIEFTSQPLLYQIQIFATIFFYGSIYEPLAVLYITCRLKFCKSKLFKVCILHLG